jgi:hypothetical protein
LYQEDEPGEAAENFSEELRVTSVPKSRRIGMKGYHGYNADMPKLRKAARAQRAEGIVRGVPA